MVTRRCYDGLSRRSVVSFIVSLPFSSDSEDCAVTSRRHDSDGESCVEVSSLV